MCDYGKQIARFGEGIVNTVRQLRLCDDIMFRFVFRNIQAAEKLLSAVMGSEISIDEVDTQAFQPMVEYRSAIFDLYARQKEGGVFVCEMQLRKLGDEIARSRFCESIATNGMLFRGASFGLLQPLTVIFFVAGDVLGEGKPIYIVNQVEQFTGVTVDGLGLQFIYINLNAKPDGSVLSNVVQDLKADDPAKMHYNWMRELYETGLNPIGDYFVHMCEAVENYANEVGEAIRAEEQARSRQMVAEEQAKSRQMVAEEQARSRQMVAEEQARSRQMVAEEQARSRQLVAEELAKAKQREAEMKADFDRRLMEVKTESNRNTAKILLSFGNNTHDEIAMATTLPLSEVDSMALSMGL